MSNRLQEGTPAKFAYRPVKYSHVEIEPGESLLLSADPWSYLKAHLLQKEKHSRGTNAANLRRAVYYAELAEDFYDNATTAGLPTVGVLQYYGMLNLVKSYISASGVELEKTWEHHGLTLPLEYELTVEVAGTFSSNNGVSIFSEFATQLDIPVTGKESITFKEICSHIPELHEVAHNLGHLQCSSRKFLPVEIDFLVNKDYSYLFTEIRYKKKHEAALPTHKFNKGERKKYFRSGYPQDGWVVYRSEKRKPLTKDNWPAVYRNFLRDFADFDLCSILTPWGYKYYCDLEPGEHHHLCYSLMAMFFIGTIARYRPSAMNEILKGDHRPLVTEALALCPRQFLYQIVSHITDSLCVVPHAKM